MSDADGANTRGWWTFGGEPTRQPLPPPRPEWFERLADLTVHGTGGEDHVAGVVRAWVEDDGGVEFHYRVFRRGQLYRCASLDGAVHAIDGRETIWRRGENGQMWSRPRGHLIAPPDDYEFGTARPDESRWEGDDFTRPTGPPAAMTFLGRAAWRVELAPPPHKPFPMQIVVEAATGLPLREGNDAFGTFHEWAELDTDADLPDHLFEFGDDDRVGRRYG